MTDATDALERSRLAAAVVDAALDVDTTARERLIAERCAGDKPLETEVRRWLSAADDPAPMFDASPMPPRSSAMRQPVLEPGVRIGPWRVVRLIGAGGMGEVYEAERVDGTFERRVALKVIASSASPALLLRRFRREREILASLDHPGIARLIDAGVSERGTPYYVMELVDGAPVDAWCDAQRLGVRARIALVRQVCAAVRYAHQRLVVHRDLKPSNVLVTNDGVVKLVDFGIARPLADAVPAADASAPATARLLTPAYASPEQFRGAPPTVAADVYSLAAVLYYLLAGQPPHHDATTWRDLERAVLEVDPPPPSKAVADAPHASQVAAARNATPEQLSRQLRGDLDTIVLTGLHKDPARRYASIETLDADLARFLNGHPVAARPDRWTYRVGKFIRRHRVGVTVAIVALAGLVATTATAVAEARRAERAAVRTAEVANFLLGLLALPYPFEGSHDRSLRSLLDSGVARAHFITPARAGGALHSDVLLALSVGYYGLGDYRTAAPLAGRAVAQRIADDPTSYSVAEARVDYAQALRHAGDLPAAIAQYDSAMPMVRARHGPRSTIGAVVLQARSRAMRASGDLDGAERSSQEVLDILVDSGTGWIQVAHAHETIGHVRLERGDIPGAEKSYREALSVRIRAKVSPVEVANAYSNLASAASAAGRLDEADSLFAQSLAVKRAQLGDRHPEVADDIVGVAHIALQRGKLDSAERGFLGAMNRYAAAGDVPFWRMAPVLDGLGDVALRRGRPAEARDKLRAALDSLSRVAVGPSAVRARLLQHLAQSQRALGHHAEAQQKAGECAAIYRAIGGAGVARALECASPNR